jgi:CheY-like chemotaxis protein
LPLIVFVASGGELAPTLMAARVMANRPHSPARVLIVDDDPNVLAVLRTLLAELGYSARLAGTGRDALRIFPGFKPDVVLMDMALLGLPGELVLECLRAADSYLPVVMVTGNADPELVRRTLPRGAFNYVAKPFNPPRLKQVLEAALAHRG